MLEIDQFDVRPAEYAVWPGIANVPGELLGGEIHLERLVCRGDAIDPRGPQRDCESDQQNRFDHGHADLGIGRIFRRHSFVVRHRIPRFPETNDGVEDEPSPSHEQDEHEDMNPADQIVNLQAVSRGDRLHSEPGSHDALDGFWSANHSVSSSSCDISSSCGTSTAMWRSLRRRGDRRLANLPPPACTGNRGR